MLRTAVRGAVDDAHDLDTRRLLTARDVRHKAKRRPIPLIHPNHAV